MIKDIVKQWENNKGKLEEYFRTTEQKDYSEYEDILIATFKYVLTGKKYNTKRLTIVDDGEYQGMRIFIIPMDTYQPYIDEYLFTYVDYGSCSGCDTLQAISDYEDGLPNEGQIKDYMTLAMHMVQRMKKWGDMED